MKKCLKDDDKLIFQNPIFVISNNSTCKTVKFFPHSKINNFDDLAHPFVVATVSNHGCSINLGIDSWQKSDRKILFTFHKHTKCNFWQFLKYFDELGKILNFRTFIAPFIYLLIEKICSVRIFALTP